MKILILYAVLGAFAAADIGDKDYFQGIELKFHKSVDIPKVAYLAAEDPERSLIVANQIRKLIENYRYYVIHGSDTHPPLDPLVIQEVDPIEYNNLPLVHARVAVRNVRLEGLQWYVLDDISVNLFRLNMHFHFTIPSMMLTTDYEAGVRVALIFTHESVGNVRLFIDRLTIDAHMGLTTTGLGHLALSHLDLGVFMDHTNIYIDGLVSNNLLNSAINRVLQKLSSDFVQNEQERISAAISEGIHEIVDDVLSQYTLADLFS